ncbi:hypothetical protein BBJ28_00018688 [Nothophytophthora sp. Chile5]|nr:hypothetical protein BBJ28_00018688 [Nothophytophthora sp. Chile5]
MSPHSSIRHADRKPPPPRPKTTKPAMGWNCSQCTFLNANDAQANCGAYGKRLNVNGKTYHPDCFCCTGCNRPLPSRFQVMNGGCYHPECVPKPKTTRKVTTTTTVSGVPKQSPVQQENQSGNANGAGWNCPTCTFHNANDAAPTCGACDAIRIMQCPTCKGEIKYVLLTTEVLLALY